MKNVRKKILIVVLVLAAVGIIGSAYRIVRAALSYQAETDLSTASVYNIENQIGDSGKRVLLLSSYEPTFALGSDRYKGVANALYPEGVALDIFYMEDHVPKSDQVKEEMVHRLQNQVQQFSYDGVILCDDAAAQLFCDHLDEIPSDLPVTFYGVNDVNLANHLLERPNTAGLLETTGFANTIEMVLSVFPDQSRIVGIIDNTPTGLGEQKEYNDLLDNFKDVRFETLNASELTREELGEKLEQLDKNAVVIYFTCFADKDGNSYSIPQSANFVTGHAPVPVISAAAGTVGNGFIAERGRGFEEDGNKAANLLLEALSGKDLTGTDLIVEDNNMEVFDAEVMDKFHVPVSRIPEGAKLVNYAPSFWEANRKILKPVMVLVFSLILVLAITLYSYLLSRRYSNRLQQSENALVERNNHLNYVSAHDTLTGLGNRYFLERVTEKYLNKPLLVLFCDMDNFKYFNDVYGHHMGDEVLRTFSAHLEKTFSEGDCFRQGGDEFLVLLPSADPGDTIWKVGALLKDLDWVKIADKEVHIGASFGYVTGSPDSAEMIHDMIRAADLYTYASKASDRNKVNGGVYDPAMIRSGTVLSYSGGKKDAKVLDSLTELFNMHAFMQRASETLLNLADETLVPSLLYFNIVNFKLYNRVYDFKEGDRVLQYIADTLRETFPERLLARFAEDHFAALVYQQEYEERLDGLIEKINDRISTQNVVVKCGICPWVRGRSIGYLCDSALMVCSSIQNRPESWKVFDQEYEEEIKWRHYILTHVDEAVKKQLIVPWYQQIRRTVTDKICSEEALARWNDPVYGILPPVRFVPILEEENILYKIDLAMVRAVLRDFGRRKEAGIPLQPVTINLSRSDFLYRDMVREVTEIVNESGFSHDLLIIEITESAYQKDQDLLRAVVNDFHANGFTVWMDDFGSGYSSLNDLQSMDFELLKIDMKFMQNFAPGTRNELIVRNIIDMAKKLGMQTLAEGVETKEQYHLLKSMGCEIVQGYYFSKPTPLPVILEGAGKTHNSLYEAFGSRSYLASIGRLDLHNPFSDYQFTGPDHEPQTEVAAAVLEIQSGNCRLLSENDAFRAFLSTFTGGADELAELHDSKEDSIAKESVISGLWEDPAFASAVKTAHRSDAWEVVTLPCFRSFRISFRLHHVADDAHTGSYAVMAVVLSSEPGQGDGSSG